MLINVVTEPATIIIEHRVRSFMYVEPDDATYLGPPGSNNFGFLSLNIFLCRINNFWSSAIKHKIVNFVGL